MDKTGAENIYGPAFDREKKDSWRRFSLLGLYRELAMDFALEMGLDFEWTVDLIDGREQAGPDLAGALALAAGGGEALWTGEGSDPDKRMAALKVWGSKRRRRLAEEGGEPFRPYGRCVLCD